MLRTRNNDGVAAMTADDFANDVSYAGDRKHMLRRAAAFVDKILKGAKPADLPVEIASRYKLVVNLKTAKALGITLPQSILLQANEVII